MTRNALPHWKLAMGLATTAVDAADGPWQGGQEGASTARWTLSNPCGT
jgi:hypothetical protein